MPLWGKTDTAADAPKYLTSAAGASPQTDVDNAFFVDTTEAAVETNRAKGIKTPGWNLVQDIGNGRYRVEPLIPMKVSAADAGDVGITNDTTTEDLIVPDTLLAITVQPASISKVAPATATFTVTATATPSTTITYQWQKQESTESGATWTNVGTDSASYTTGVTAVAPGAGATNGDKYRVLVSAPTKTSQIITSSTAILTVTAS